MTVLCRDVFFAFLEDQGVPYIFGNPGTTELPLVDGCADHPSVRYVLSLHEDIAIAQATGYARASGRIGVVNLHVAPGVAHGLGNLYNAFRARVPLLVTAGQHHTRLIAQDPILTADLAEMVRPFTKWAYEVAHASELPLVLQRAFKEVTTPPYGPVFVSLPMNLMLEEYPDDIVAAVSQMAPTIPTESGVSAAAEVLRTARRPMILSGDGVGHAHAWEEVVALAELIGAPVYTEGYSTLWNYPADHPLFAGPMPNLATDMRNQFADVDTLLMCGVTAQAPVSRYDDGGPLVPWRIRTVSVDDNPADVGKNQPVSVGLVGHVKHTLSALLSAVQRNPPDPDTVGSRTLAAKEKCAVRVRAWSDRVAEARASADLSATLVAAELRQRLGPDGVFVDETISNRPSFVNVLPFSDPLAYFAANGLSLGYSPAAAVGIKMALPHRRVVNAVGDGSLMYYPQALWNAAHEQTPVVFIVLNNGEYRVLKQIIDRMGGPWGGSTQMPASLDLGEPRIDFVGLAAAMGVAGERVTTPAALSAALDRAFVADAPYLIDVVVHSTTP